MDNDGDLDIVAILKNKTTTWMKNDGNGNFYDPIDLPTFLQNNVSINGNVVINDLDNDGNLDIISCTNLAGFDNKYAIKWYKNDGNGNFPRPKILHLTNEAFLNNMFTDDMDNDKQQ